MHQKYVPPNVPTSNSSKSYLMPNKAGNPSQIDATQYLIKFSDMMAPYNQIIYQTPQKQIFVTGFYSAAILAITSWNGVRIHPPSSPPKSNIPTPLPRLPSIRLCLPLHWRINHPPLPPLQAPPHTVFITCRSQKNRNNGEATTFHYDKVEPLFCPVAVAVWII